jgi:Flp pilus assembly protein TadG
MSTKTANAGQYIFRNARGATTLEFAFVAPVLALVLMGTTSIAYRQYDVVMLQGALQEAARDGTLETGGSVGADAALDAIVRENFKRVNSQLPDSAFTFTRRNFVNFTSAGQMEPSTGPGGRCAPPSGGTTYTYVDINNGNSWDDGAINGQGGAQDVVLYTVKVDYPAVFPVPGVTGLNGTQTLTASTVLRNQPYNNQQARTAGPTRNCPLSSPYYS